MSESDVAGIAGFARTQLCRAVIHQLQGPPPRPRLLRLLRLYSSQSRTLPYSSCGGARPSPSASLLHPRRRTSLCRRRRPALAPH